MKIPPHSLHLRLLLESAKQQKRKALQLLQHPRHLADPHVNLIKQHLCIKFHLYKKFQNARLMLNRLQRQLVCTLPCLNPIWHISIILTDRQPTQAPPNVVEDIFLDASTVQDN